MISPQIYRLLLELSDAEFHSGASLGELLGVSRAGIWKMIRKISELGLEVHTVKGKGYRLSEKLELLNKNTLLDNIGMAQRRQLSELELLPSLVSTNSHAMERLRRSELDLAQGQVYVCLTEQQTAGRGRRGRQWISPFGHNIYLTMVREFNAGAASLEGLSLVVGLALRRVLSRYGVKDAGLKWPNDVHYQNKKLAGILLEINGDLTGQCQVVIGLGVNVKMPAAQQAYTASIDQDWIDLAGILPQLPERNLLVAVLIEELIDILKVFETKGFAAFIDEWHEFDIFLGKTVSLKSSFDSGTEAISGLCRGVDQKGGLILETSSGLETFYGGELSARADQNKTE